jgi:hypothetical protein
MKKPLPAEAESLAVRESHFDCRDDNHLLPHGPNVMAIYSLACAVVHNKPRHEFYASAANVAAHYKIAVNTVRRAFKTLCQCGFLEKQPGLSDHGTCTYRVVYHEEWAAAHPGQCLKTRRTASVGTVGVNPEVNTGNPASKTTSAKKRLSEGGHSADPHVDAVTSILRALGRVSDIPFLSYHREKLAHHLKTYTQEELVSAFKFSIDALDMDDPSVRGFAAENFVNNADSLCHNAREDSAERARERAKHDALKIRLQEEAEADRERARIEREAEQDAFDPLADL